MLGCLRQCDRHGAVEGKYFDIPTEGCGGYVNFVSNNKVLAPTLKAGIGGDVQDDEKVAGEVGAGLSFAGDLEGMSVLDARRHINYRFRLSPLSCRVLRTWRSALI